MAKADLKHSFRARCHHCGDMLTVRLALGDKSAAIDCPSCGGHVTTVGEFFDATIEQVAAILLDGLNRRAGR